jgi:drug/metabolite transporter (DMT)-like permease
MSRATTIRLGLLALLWGSSFLWIAVALRGLNPAQIAFARLALGATVLTALIYVRGQRLPTGRALWLHLTVAALFGNALPYYLLAVAEQHIDSGVAGVINATTPLWTLALAYGTGHDRALSPSRVAGLLIGFIGTVVIFSPWDTSGDIASWGGLACLIASASYAISYVYMDRYLARRGTDSLGLSASQLLAAAIMAIALPFAHGFAHAELRADAVAAIVVLGALGTGAASS